MGIVRGCKVVEYNIVRTRQGSEMAPRKTIPSKLPARKPTTKIFNDEGQTTSSYE